MPFKIKLAGIYKIQRIGTDNYYIGQSLNIFRRWALHRHQLRKGIHHSRYLQNSFNKHGEDAFCFEVVEQFNQPINTGTITAAEQRWIDRLKPKYNMCPAAGSCAGLSRTDEARSKMRAAKETRAKMSASRLAWLAAREGHSPCFPQL